MKIVFHSADNDGRASAAIIYREFGLMQMMQESDFIGFDYNKGVEFPEVKEGEVWFFVDISLGWESFAQIKKCVEGGAKVYHIDHHRNGEFMEQNMSPEDLEIMDQVVKFYDIHESATMLCWIYTHMSGEEKEDPMRLSYDFSEGYTHFIFNGNEGMEYAIPIGFRYVNDQDMFRMEFEDTAAFTAGIINIQEQKVPFNEYDSIHPMSKVWVEIFRSDRRFLAKVIETGRKVIEEDEKLFAELRKTAFESELELDGETYKVICIETDRHGSKVAGDLYFQYDGYVRFNYDDKVGKWTYTIYSRDTDKFVPCHKMCNKIDSFGGGHLHAAGCSTEVNIFEKR